MPQVNINAIGKSSSGRLASVLNAELADEIIKDRELRGEFKDFEDLEERVRGLGPVKIQKLKDANFVINAAGGGGGAAVADLDTHFPGLRRGDVNKLKDQTWRHRDNKCLYTLLTPSKMKSKNHEEEVDHVIECQVLELANKISGDDIGPAYRTRGTQESLRAIFNNVSNLNVTTNFVNQKKKGPFETWINNKKAGRSNRTIEDILPDSKAKVLVDDGTWSNIEKAMVKVYDELEEDAKDFRAEAQRAHAERILEEIKNMMSQMGIN